MRLAFLSTVIAVLALGACWTGEVAREKQPTPSGTSTRRPVSHASELERHDAWLTLAVMRASPSRLSADQTRAEHELELLLGADGPLVLPTEVPGPVVVLDIGTGTFTKLCGSDARLAAHDWGTQLADEARPAPRCSFSAKGATLWTTRAVCWQLVAHHALALELIRDRANERLDAVVVGAVPSELDPALARQLEQRVATATCP